MMQDDNGRGGGAADYSRDKGGQALGARLRRLSERIDSDGTRIYAVRGVVFEQRWFGVLNQMILQGDALVERMTPLWAAFNEVAADLNEEAGDVVAALDRLDDALARKSMFDRISERIQGLASKAD